MEKEKIELEEGIDIRTVYQRTPDIAISEVKECLQ